MSIGGSMEKFVSPINGRITSLENVKDEIFAQKMMGDGIAVIPSENEFYSPVDGEITMLFETEHAFGILTPNGAEILVHIGVDTVTLGSDPYETKIKVGDKVKTGDLLTIIDWKYINDKGLDTIIPIISTNKAIELNETEKDVTVGDFILNIID